MSLELKIHPSFFREFATKTWVSPYDIVKELIENAFDEDATRVLVTILPDGSIYIEDNAGIDSQSMEKFLLLGSPHKKTDSISPKFKRLRTGRYGTGRLSFLTSYEKMVIKTKKENYQKCIVIDGSTLDDLFKGISKLHELKENSLNRNGTELSLLNPKIHIDFNKLIKEIRKLAILRQPLFEVFVKQSNVFTEWNFENAQPIRAPDIQGHRIPVHLEDGKIIGELVVARRPLNDEERGIAVMVGNHIVTRTSFGFDSKLNRVTGFVRCDSLTSRFADKSALIEDEEYSRFTDSMKDFILNTVIPNLNEYEDVLITKEESRIYKEIDKVLGQAIVENLESVEEIQEYETIDSSSSSELEEEKNRLQYSKKDNLKSDSNDDELDQKKQFSSKYETISSKSSPSSYISGDLSQKFDSYPSSDVDNDSFPRSIENQADIDQSTSISDSNLDNTTGNKLNNYETSDFLTQNTNNNLIINPTTFKKIRKPVLKKTFVLRKIGYKVIPYEDETDSRYSFANENIVFVNKANSTYKAESLRGDEFLLRHIIRIVAEYIAETKHPEGKEALELQNRLIVEALRIHNSKNNKLK